VTLAALIQQAQAAGVAFRLADGAIVVSGSRAAVNGLLEPLRQAKAVLLDYLQAANDPAQAVALEVNPALAVLVSTEPAAAPDPDRWCWCWPYSAAMTGKEIDTLIERTALFNRRGLSALDAELLADKLVNRDRDRDRDRDREGGDRRLCLECAHLSGAMRCAQWQRAGLGQPGVPAGLPLVLQRCNGFEDQNLQRTTSNTSTR